MLTDIMTGTNYIGTGDTSCHSGTTTYDLGSQAVSDLQNNLSNDFFAMGLGWTDFTRNSNDVATGDVIDLSLTVTYDGVPPDNTKLLGLNDVTFNVGTTSASVVGIQSATYGSTPDYEVADTSGTQGLYSGSYHISAMAVKSGSALINEQIAKVEIPMYKVGSPTGTVTAGVFDSSGNTVHTFGTMQASDISTSNTWYAFEGTSSHTLASGQEVIQMAVGKTLQMQTNQLDCM